MNKQEKTALNEKLLKFAFPKARLRYKDEDGLDLFTPEYIASGKSFRTHMIDAKPIPSFTRDLNACFLLLIPKIPTFHYVSFFSVHDGPNDLTDCLFNTYEHHYDARGQQAAVALCLAVEQLIDKGLESK